MVVVDLVDDDGKAESASAALAGREGTVESRADGDGRDGSKPKLSRAEKRAERGRVVTWRVGLFGVIAIVILVGAAASSIFFLLMIMSVVDVVAGFTISITGAGRDVTMAP